MELRIESRSHVVLEKWMVSELGLHGNKLVVYAIIYGCSLAGNQEFTASINYFCEWLDLSRSQVLSILKELEEARLIHRRSTVRDGITYNSYRAEIPITDEEFAQCMPPPVTEEELPWDEIPYQEIVDYLNKKLGTNYRANAVNTKKHIRARWMEKNTLEDFYTVIDGRVKEWKHDKKMCEYLRPDTLFGTKFESYLQDAKRKGVHSQDDTDDAPVLDENGKPKEY